MFKAREALRRKQLNKQADGSVTVTMSNPTKCSYINGPDAGTVLNSEPAGLRGDDLVLTLTPDGEWQVRPHGASGGWEGATDKDGFVNYHAGGDHCFQIPVGD